MSVQILAAIAFVVLFIAWVVVPSRLRKKHVSKAEDETLE